MTTSGKYIDLICNELLTCQGLNLNLGHFCSFTFILISCGESCLFFSWCIGDMCDMTDSDEDRDKSKRPGVEDRR
jgi:hypothetical protein